MKKIFFIFLFLFSIISYAEELIIEPDMGRAPLLSAISNTQYNLQLVIYGITDPDIIKSLIKLCERGKKVQVLLEPTPYKSEGENNLALREFKKNNLEFKIANPEFQLTHQKTFIIDDKESIIMTFNLTRSAFKNQRNFAIIETDPKIITEIKNIFNADWLRKPSAPNYPNLLWSPNNSRSKLIKLIRQARNEIKIYAQNLTDYQFIGELAKAARHGVTVKILLSDAGHKNQAKYHYLSRAGVFIRQSKTLLIHAKVICIDHNVVELGSINFTKPSLDNNRELGVITQNKTIIKQIETTFDHDWSV